MTDLSNATMPALFVRRWRIRLALLVMRVSHALCDLAEWVMPEDLRRGL